MGQFRKGASFSAQDEDGHLYNIVTWVEYVDMADDGGAHYNWAPSGFEALRLEDGRSVRTMGSDHFSVGESGPVLHRAGWVHAGDASGSLDVS